MAGTCYIVGCVVEVEEEVRGRRRDCVLMLVLDPCYAIFSHVSSPTMSLLCDYKVFLLSRSVGFSKLSQSLNTGSCPAEQRSYPADHCFAEWAQ